MMSLQGLKSMHVTWISYWSVAAFNVTAKIQSDVNDSDKGVYKVAAKLQEKGAPSMWKLKRMESEWFWKETFQVNTIHEIWDNLHVLARLEIYGSTIGVLGKCLCIPGITDQTQIPDSPPDPWDRRSDQTVAEEGPASGALRMPELKTASETPARASSAPAAFLFLIFVKMFFDCEGQVLECFGQIVDTIDDDDQVFLLHDHRSVACMVRSPIRFIPNVKEISQGALWSMLDIMKFKSCASARVLCKRIRPSTLVNRTGTAGPIKWHWTDTRDIEKILNINVRSYNFRLKTNHRFYHGVWHKVRLWPPCCHSEPWCIGNQRTHRLRICFRIEYLRTEMSWFSLMAKTP